MLYADENKITSEGAEYLYESKKTIIYASLKGNQISDEAGRKIQINMTFKGGYMEY